MQLIMSMRLENYLGYLKKISGELHSQLDTYMKFTNYVDMLLLILTIFHKKMHLVLIIYLYKFLYSSW